MTGLAVVFAVMSVHLVRRHREHMTENERRLLSIELVEQTGTTYYGLYFGQEKEPIGYTMRTTAPEADGGTRMDSWMFVKLKVLGRPQDVQTVGSIYHDDRGRFTKFDYQLTSSAGDFLVEGEVRDPAADQQVLDLVIHTPGGGQRREKMTLPPDLTFYDEIPRKVLSTTPREGDTFDFTVLDPTNLGTAPLTVTVNGWRDTSGGQRALLLAYDYKGVALDVVVDERGEVLKEKSPMGFESERISYEQARRLAEEKRELPDIISLTGVTPTGNPIADPRRLINATYRIGGLDLSRFPALDGNGQTVDGATVTVHPAIPRSSGPPPGNDSPWLAATPLVQTDHVSIRTLSKRLTRRKSAYVNANTLSHYVFKTLEKMPVVSMPSAVDILRSRKGDCNEHATLYAALARSAGIPTRVVGGLVLLEGRFLYHAWNEVYANGRWTAVDPTFGQLPVDATHIRFAEGTDVRELSDLMPLVGKVKVHVVKTETATGGTAP